jgi:hypothetical protein
LDAKDIPNMSTYWIALSKYIRDRQYIPINYPLHFKPSS